MFVLGIRVAVCVGAAIIGAAKGVDCLEEEEELMRRLGRRRLFAGGPSDDESGSASSAPTTRELRDDDPSSVTMPEVAEEDADNWRISGLTSYGDVEDPPPLTTTFTPGEGWTGVLFFVVVVVVVGCCAAAKV